MEKSGLLGRLQRRLQLAGCNRIDMGRSRAHANWLNSWRVQSKPARWGAIPQPGAALRYLPLRAPAEPAPALKLGPRIRARDAERKANVRARSAVMRSA